MDTFAALADPTRRRIFELIAEGERSVGDIVKRFEFSPPTISQHLNILKKAGLVGVRSDKQKRIYSARAEGLRDLEIWLESQKNIMAHRLDSLERHLDAKLIK